MWGRKSARFSQQSQDLASSLASQAAVALENNLLYRDIEKLFEGFVRASVTAIESRDPTTFGHSERVAKLTVALAETVDRLDSGPYKDIHFTREDIREIRYASILHDFGKVGVREEVLVKAKKLYPPQLELIKKRFQYIRKSLELEAYRKKLDHVLRNGNQGYEECFALIDGEQGRELQNLDEFLQDILQANEPTVLPEKISEKLVQIAGWSFDDPSGPTEPLLTPEELQLLSITKGSLNPDERLQIESHVIHSFRFLSQIPWTKELRARAGNRPGASRETGRLGIPLPHEGGRHSLPIEDDDHLGYFRCAHGARPALQASGAGRSRPSDHRQRSEVAASRSGAVQPLHRGQNLPTHRQGLRPCPSHQSSVVSLQLSAFG